MKGAPTSRVPSPDAGSRNCDTATPKPEDKKCREDSPDVTDECGEDSPDVTDECGEDCPDVRGEFGVADEVDGEADEEEEEEAEEEAEGPPLGRKTRTRSGLVSILELKSDEKNKEMQDQAWIEASKRSRRHTLRQVA